MPVLPTKPQWIRRPNPAFARYTAIATACLAGLGTALLLIAASHVHVDRSTGRRPVITWQGPLAAYADELAWCGWLASAAAMGLCVYANNVYRSK